MKEELLEVALYCARCNSETSHRLVYAGRLLVSTTCLVCYTRNEHESNDLWDAYLKDLPHRIATKPLRIWKRILRAPALILWELPKATIKKPIGMIREFRKLKKRN